MAAAGLSHLRTVSSALEARVIAARLGADGIPVQLTGGCDGPYPMGPVQLWVLAADADEATALLLVDEAEWVVARAGLDVDALLDDADPATRRRPAVPPAVVAVPLLGMLVVSLLLRVS